MLTDWTNFGKRKWNGRAKWHERKNLLVESSPWAALGSWGGLGGSWKSCSKAWRTRKKPIYLYLFYISFDFSIVEKTFFWEGGQVFHFPSRRVSKFVLPLSHAGKHELQLVWCVESASDHFLPRIEYGRERELLPPNLLDVVDREGLRFQYPTTNELPSLREPKSGYSAISNPCSRRGFRTLSSVLALSLLVRSGG